MSRGHNLSEGGRLIEAESHRGAMEAAKGTKVVLLLKETLGLAQMLIQRCVLAKLPQRKLEKPCGLAIA